MQEYSNAMNKQQSDQLAKIQQRQQQIQQQQEHVAKIEQQRQIEQIQHQQEEIQQIQQQQEEIQKQQIKIQEDQLANKANQYYNNAPDITQIYAERHWSEQLVNDDSVFLFVLSAQGDILYCSDSCQGLTGYHAIDVVGHSISEFLHPDDQPPFYALLDRVFETPLRLSQISFRWKMKSPVAGLFASMQCFGYSKPDDVPSFTLTTSNHLESSYYAFFALAQVREPSTADVLVQLKKENQRLQQQLTQFAAAADAATTTTAIPTSAFSSSSSVIATWMQSDVSTIPWLAPPPQNTIAQPGFSQNQPKTTLSDDHGSAASTLSHQKDRQYTKQTTKNAKANPTEDDTAKKKKKVYVTLEEHECSDCGTTNSPEWRKGPLGRKTLCNACGLRWAKKNKKVNLEG